MIGPKFRIVSGPPAVVEREINREWDTYVIGSITLTVVKDELIVTALMTAASEVRKMQLLNPAGGMGRPH